MTKLSGLSGSEAGEGRPPGARRAQKPHAMLQGELNQLAPAPETEGTGEPVEVASVAADLALDRTFDYLVPDAWRGRVTPGWRVRVPFGNRDVFGFVVDVRRERRPVGGGGPLKRLAECLGNGPLIDPDLMRLAHWLAAYYACPFERALAAALPEAVRRPRAAFREPLAAHLEKAPDADMRARLERRAPKQAAALRLLETEGPQLLAQAAKQGVPTSAWRALEREGWVRIGPMRQERDPLAGRSYVPSLPLTLNPEQRGALDAVLEEMRAPEPKPVLLLGVTGSGKTEIYLQAIDACLQEGRGAIVLVPEIALTPQSVERFQARFMANGVEIAVLHSHLSDGERHDAWHKIRDGRARLVIGARSAIFAPVVRLGLIVVDEEHEPSYKQQESPRYQARDVAVMRGRLARVAVVLGSATPSMESWHNAHLGKYRLVRMTRRVDDQTLPLVHIVDMRHDAIRTKGPAVISRRLRDLMAGRLERREQTILFLNRRGYASSVLCPKCGHVVQCPDCSVPVTFHKSFVKVVCHMCGFEQGAPKTCSECGDPAIRFVGMGTERVEQAVATLFPKAHLARMDSDTMRRKGAHEQVFTEFRRGAIDILIGTQMIAKGLHFPNVTLVGIVNADQALHLPDFRASERVFQLLTQVAGRAGRGDRAGEVIVQTFTPHHPAVQFARRHDYEGFAEEEMALREQAQYPPFCRAVLITARSRAEDKAAFVCERLAARLREGEATGIEVLGPAPAPIAKIQTFHRFHIFVRSRTVQPVTRRLAEILERDRPGPDVTVTVDVDPVDLM